MGSGNNAISKYDDQIPTDSNDISRGTINNVIKYSSPIGSVGMYAFLRSKIDNSINEISIYSHDKYEQSISGEISNLATKNNYTLNSSANFKVNDAYKNSDGTTVKSFVETIINDTVQSKAYTVGSKDPHIDRTPTETLKDGKNNINALPSAFKYYSGRKTIGEYERYNDRNVNSDELAVIFTPINPFTGNKVSKKFLAYLTDYSENYDSGWNETKYVGRAESFYIFNSFKRTATIGLNIPCFNQKELTNNHSKLFALGKTGLAYALAGQYNEKNLLGGVITELTLGNYLVATPGIITNFNFSVPQESPWDLNKKYAHVIKVTFQFTIIGNEVPQYETLTPTPLPDPTPTPTPQNTGSGGGGGNTPPTSSVLPPLNPRFKQTRDDRDHTYVRPQVVPDGRYKVQQTREAYRKLYDLLPGLENRQARPGEGGFGGGGGGTTGGPDLFPL